MQPNANPTSTRLENLSFEADGASLGLDGRMINITGDAGTPSVAALHAFHQSALADYRARQRMGPRPGLLSRFKSWLGGLFAKNTRVPPVLAAPSAAVPGELKPQSEWHGLPARERGEHGPEARATPAPEMGRRGQVDLLDVGRPDIYKIDLTPSREPKLRAAYADKEGVHLIWLRGPKTDADPEVAFTCRLDSELAGKLQDCYGQLGKLGYKVTGLEVVQGPSFVPPSGTSAGGARVIPVEKETPLSALEKRALPAAAPLRGAKQGGARLNSAEKETMPNVTTSRESKVEPSPAPDAKKEIKLESVAPEKTTLTDIPEEAAPPAEVPSRDRGRTNAGGKKPTMVLDVSGAPSHDPRKEAPVLAAPERLLTALRAGLDPERAAEDRLTHLRGTLGKNGLKIVEVGFGDGKDHAPARWEDASKWLARQAEPETPAKAAQAVLPEI